MGQFILFPSPTASDLITSVANTASIHLTLSGGVLTADLVSPLLLANGLVSAPSLAFTSDSTTGMYRVSAGVIGFSSAGAAAGQFTANGLEVLAGSGSSTQPLAVRKDANANTIGFIRNDNTGSSARASWDIISAVGTVELSATSSAAGAKSFISIPSGFTGGFFLDQAGANPITLKTNNVARLTVAGSGEVTASGQVRCASLGVGNSASATTPGSVVKKVEVFDASGTSLGFMALYDSIS